MTIRTHAKRSVPYRAAGYHWFLVLDSSGRTWTLDVYPSQVTPRSDALVIDVWAGSRREAEREAERIAQEVQRAAAQRAAIYRQLGR